MEVRTLGLGFFGREFLSMFKAARVEYIIAES